MTAIDFNPPRRAQSLWQRIAPRRQQIPFMATVLVCLLMYLTGCILYHDRGFFTVRVLGDLFSGNAVLGIAAIGLSFVILSGGIDLSVGAAIGCGTITMATLIQDHHWPPVLVMAMTLAAGLAFGALQGSLIHFFSLPPFLITLGGLFFCRGVGLLISDHAVDIGDPLYDKLSMAGIPLGDGVQFRLTAVIFVATLAVALFVSIYTAFGRNVYAIGGSEQSSLLMGLPVGRTKVSIYALSGFCSALAAIVQTINTPSGNALTGMGLELDAIAAVVIGGTLLSGGVGYVAGTLLGVLIFGMIQSMLDMQGDLSTWWIKIAIGVLLLAFILLQKLIQRRSVV